MLGLVCRLILLAYGEWQDRTMIVKYTDVDYRVFTDAAQYVLQGDSPYNRPTYRYTPLLAWILVPNILLTLLFGKIIFILCDIMAGILIYKILKQANNSDQVAVLSSLLWLLNPLTMTVSSRGNAESIMAVLVLATLYSLTNKHIVTCAILYAISVHVKIYPATYALPIYLLLGSVDSGTGKSLSRQPIRDLHTKSLVANILNSLWPNKDRLVFVVVTVAVFLGLTGAMYNWYGYEFLQETYLYHVTRRDVRHNFSPYFYMLYLTAESPSSFVLGLLAFLPQVVLLIAVSARYHRDIAFCCFVHTFLFVTFNKVCTSQYFLWYICLLPLIVPRLKMKLSDAVELMVIWFLGQGVWLLFAYYLEFEGRNTFIAIWAAGILFYAINIFILVCLIQAYHQRCPEDQTSLLDDKDKVS